VCDSTLPQGGPVPPGYIRSWPLVRVRSARTWLARRGAYGLRQRVDVVGAVVATPVDEEVGVR